MTRLGLADLHVHSARSDGALSPAATMGQAQATGLTYVALTDHDTILGVAEAVAAGVQAGIEVIPGVELSVQETARAGSASSDLHVLGLFVNTQAPELTSYLAQAGADRASAMDESLTRLEELRMPVDRARVQDLAAGGVVTRPHLARALVEAGYVTSEEEAFSRFLGTGGPAAPQRATPDVRVALAAVHAAGGLGSLAHPIFCHLPDWQERLGRLPALLDRLVSAGLDAVECFYPDARPAVAEQLVLWSQERGLLATGGTDYHGVGKAPFAPLGQVTVSAEMVDQLRVRAHQAR